MTTEALAIAAREGDVDAFTALVERYQAMAFGYALVILGDYHLAEDAVQIAFVTAYGHLGSLRDPARFGGWLRGIVRFECLRMVRNRQRQPALSLDGSVVRASPDQSPEDEAVNGETLAEILALLSALPEPQRVVAALYYLQDRSQADVSEFLGLPVSTINNRLREARRFLRHHGAHLMNDFPPANPDLAQSIGTVLWGRGRTIDARITGDARPDLLTAVQVSTNERSIGAFIAQYLDDDVARLVVQPGGTHDDIAPGGTIRSRGVAVTTPVDSATIEQLISASTIEGSPDTIQTGIKVIDLFAPLVAGGTVAIIGDRNVGKLVLVDELVHRLRQANHPSTLLAFMRTPDETGMMHLLEHQVTGPVSVIGVPVADASPEALASSLSLVDTVLVMSRDLGRDRHYPAIDPLTSRATQQADDDLIETARRLLADADTDDPRASALRAYLTQPFFVAEPWTKRPGQIVDLRTARADLATILSGDLGTLTGRDLFMQGSLGDVAPLP